MSKNRKTKGKKGPTPSKESPAERKKARVATQRHALQQKCEQIKVLELQATSNECEVRYQIGVEILAIKNNAKTYGSNAIGTIAKHIGRDQNTLYEYKKVAECWPDAKEFKKLTKLKNNEGVPLSFSHFVLLADKKLEPARREKLIETALAKSLPVSALSAEIHPKQEVMAIVAAGNFATGVGSRAEGWSKKVDELEGSATQFDHTIRACEEGADALQTLVEKLRTRRDQGSLDAPAAPLVPKGLPGYRPQRSVQAEE